MDVELETTLSQAHQHDLTDYFVPFLRPNLEMVFFFEGFKKYWHTEENMEIF